LGWIRPGWGNLSGAKTLSRPLLILDIDETLIHAVEQPLDRDCDLRADQFHVYFRPHVTEFLVAVSSCYDLAVWSSATADYLKLIVGALMANIAVPLFVWDRNKCNRRMDFIQQEEYFLKDLRKVKRKGFELERILVLEDEPRKVWRNYGNAIYVQPFLGQIEDDELEKLVHYLLTIRSVPDFRTLEKRFWRSTAQTKIHTHE
jgi:carboxy-terminal domain RNA polymerase II polypeptide A small phosphatase